MLKHLIQSAFHLLGYDITPVAIAQRSTMAGALAQLAKQGLAPRVVIDVGAGSGTAELYKAFPRAHHLLIEPLHEFESSLRDVLTRFQGEYVLAVASDAPGSATLNVHARDLYGSSLFHEAEGAYADGTPRQVPAVTIDQLVSERSLQGPFLLKADVQGAELKALRGATETLRQAEAVILEVLLFGTLLGGPQMADVIAYMKSTGFVPYDIFGALYRPLDNALSQVDMVFVREQGMFRREHGYATREQRMAMWACK
jgi:FkbM family methyltransferase